MIRYFFKRLYRERRRLLVTCALTFAAGAWAFHTSSTRILSVVPFWLFSGLVMMIGETSFLMLFVVLFPKIRFTAEMMAGLVLFMSLVGSLRHLDSGPLPSWAWITGATIAMVALQTYILPILDRLLPLRARRYLSVATSRLPPEALFEHLCSTPDQPAPLRDPNLVSSDWIEPGKSYRIVERQGDHCKVEEIHTIEAAAPGQSFRFRWEALDARADAPFVRGTKEFVLAPHHGGTRLTTLRMPERTSWRVQIFAWIDDAFGRLDDKEIRQAETIKP